MVIQKENSFQNNQLLINDYFIKLDEKEEIDQTEPKIHQKLTKDALETHQALSSLNEISNQQKRFRSSSSSISSTSSTSSSSSTLSPRSKKRKRMRRRPCPQVC